MSSKKKYRAVFAVLWAAFVYSGVIRYASTSTFEAIAFMCYAFAMSAVAARFVKWARLTSLDSLPANCPAPGCTKPKGHAGEHGRVNAGEGF